MTRSASQDAALANSVAAVEFLVMIAGSECSGCAFRELATARTASLQKL